MQIENQITPPSWQEALMDKFCVMFERSQDEECVTKLENFIHSTRLEAVEEYKRGLKKEIKTMQKVDDEMLCERCKLPSEDIGIAYNQALNDILKHIDKL